ncbi:MAG: GMC family oxidoreductase N-terminal domain-containing protein [Proteobacteria bacterium]|nr:GMC family oxidoreductase N-terminal domain-containing protein [Pseudomonadota bacterium]
MVQEKTIQYDAIVAGSGPGGATVARELSRRGMKVLILEWGGGEPLTGSLKQAATMVGVPGQSLLFTAQGLSMARGITVGGSSVIYCGTAFEPPHEMLASYGMDIRKEVAEVRAELPIGPLSDGLMGPQQTRIMESAQDLGYAWNKIDKYLYQDKCLGGCDRCFLGCPHRAKWTARNWVEEACENGATLITRARVKRVILENGKAVGVTYSQWGREHKALAPLTIISAGGIGTPVILRNTGLKRAGYDFFFDPLITVFGAADDLSGRGEVPMAAGVHLPGDGYMMTDMTVHHSLYEAFSAQVGRVDRLFAHKRTMAIMIKAKDSLGGHLTDSGGVRKNLAKSDAKKLAHGYERARKILANAGAKNIYKSWYIAAHPGGTAKVNELVDKNLKTEIDNLYVCDCSVIPEAWGLPPTLTLLGLGKRLAAHLAEKAGRKEEAAAA